MAIFRAQNLSKSFGERTLFSCISCEVFERDRIGLVGVNGCGKTTLLRMIAGQEPADGEGSLFVSKTARIAMLDQSPTWNGDATLYEATLEASSQWMEIETELSRISARIEAGENPASLIRRQADLQERYQSGGGLTYRARTRSTLLGLGFSDEEMARPISKMSGGQMRKAALAKILMSDADFILLDEPTNHLDIASLEWLESFLVSFRGAVLVISHDRYFLDHVCTRIFELENGGMTCFNGNYSAYAERKMDAHECAMRKYRNGLREIKRIEGIIEQQRRWNQARNYVTIASKQKQIERLKRDLVKPEEDRQAIHFQLKADPLTANEVVVCRNLSKSFGDTPLFEHLDLMIRKDERVCLLGANGCGKTTLLRILLSRIEPDEGTFKLGSNVHVGYYEQSAVHTGDQRTILQYFSDVFPRFDQQVFRNLLGSFLFRGDDVQKRVCDLSGGEYARVKLLTMMLSGSNVLFLDEPTNHLDIPSCEALENALSAYGGTMLIVTHDRYLANRIADRILILDKSGFLSFDGDWDGYKALLAENEESSEPEQTEKNAYTRAKERRGAINRAKGALERAEARIASCEAEIASIEARLCAPEIASDYELSNALYCEMSEKRSYLETCYAEWESAEEAYRALLEEDE